MTRTFFAQNTKLMHNEALNPVHPYTSAPKILIRFL
jgi:hypothetical protein